MSKETDQEVVQDSVQEGEGEETEKQEVEEQQEGEQGEEQAETQEGEQVEAQEGEQVETQEGEQVETEETEEVEEKKTKISSNVRDISTLDTIKFKTNGDWFDIGNDTMMIGIVDNEANQKLIFAADKINEKVQLYVEETEDKKKYIFKICFNNECTEMKKIYEKLLSAEKKLYNKMKELLGEEEVGKYDKEEKLKKKMKVFGKSKVDKKDKNSKQKEFDGVSIVTDSPHQHIFTSLIHTKIEKKGSKPAKENYSIHFICRRGRDDRSEKIAMPLKLIIDDVDGSPSTAEGNIDIDVIIKYLIEDPTDQKIAVFVKSFAFSYTNIAKNDKGLVVWSHLQFLHVKYVKSDGIIINEFSTKKMPLLTVKKRKDEEEESPKTNTKTQTKKTLSVASTNKKNIEIMSKGFKKMGGKK